MIQFILQHQFWSAIVAYWIYSAAVSAMPDPKEASAAIQQQAAHQIYAWLYQFLHTIAGNLTTAFGNKIPGVKP